MRFTRGQNGYESIFLDIDHIPITEDYEIVCGWDSGKTFSTENDRKFSLQKIQPGNVFTIFNLTAILPPFGVKLDRGTTQRIVHRVRDNCTALDEFNCIVHGFERFE